MSKLSLTSVIALSTLAVLSGCQQRDASSLDASAQETTFHAANYPLGMTYDTELARVDGDASSYFDNGGWQLQDDAPGERLVALTLPESNDVTTALWRLGASRNANAVDRCLTLPANAQTLPSQATIAGNAFTAFTLDDAGMSHFQNIEGYRAVIDDTCYAVDMIVQGVNGMVYDPPRQPPFSKEEAMARLRSINDGISFDSE
ncbi:hypothetical protein [Salinicola socius]|uniref:Uncharacterized protein n=1 Tax=Salinicola socius TaxID=404433 RepID=A0A1Q8SVD1_9GAMM|nr:hypothetical protein [Salinicola socius]OLO05342.1 hypothetical protein BTW07_04770 [Salinicola socius]